MRREHEAKVEAPVRAASESIADARFKLIGSEVYPDATFTLRLNFGTVRGWTENGREVEPFTYLRGLFERATGREPFRIPLSWHSTKARLDFGAKFNLATDNDIVGVAPC